MARDSGMTDDGIAIQRAVARMLAESRQRKLTPVEEDCLALHLGTCRVHAGMVPDYSVLENTAAYRRGSELRDEIHGPIIPYHQDPHAQRSNIPSLYFEQLHGREPVAGDVLRQSDWETYQFMELMSLAHFIDAWHRQMPDLFCPLKIEDGRRVYKHERVYRSELPRDYPGRESLPAMFTEWREPEEYTAEGWWNRMDHALNVSESEMAAIQGITFLGVIDGEHRCRPATEAEVGKIAFRPT